MEKKFLRFDEAINKSLNNIMTKNKSVVYFGLGADDSTRVFNTTNQLREKFGKFRVFDTPLSENAMTGLSVGMSLNGLIPIMSHQRLDFFLLAMDQLVNSAAKWNFMFGKKDRINIVIRLIIGRGWGQGPTHSQNLQSWFAHIPGLKVLSPSFPSSAQGLLEASTLDPNPTIIIENRWCHQLKESLNSIKKNKNKFKIGKSIKLNSGSDITIITSSYSTIEFYQCYSELKKYKISFDHIDLLSIKPLDISVIFNSVKKTGRLVIFDNSSHKICSIGSEIISQLVSKNHTIFKNQPLMLFLPDIHQPTSYHLTKDYFISKNKIIYSILKVLKKNKQFKKIKDTNFHDIVDDQTVYEFKKNY